MRFGNGGLDPSQVETRRGMGGGTGLAVGGGGLGVVGLVIWLIASLVGGGSSGPFGDVNSGLNRFPDSAQAPQQASVPQTADLTETRFVTAVVNDVQQSWTETFAEAGRTYQPTTLVLFSGATATGCGAASAATGPFYCPADHRVYLDLGFFNELKTRFGAPGDFAQAYVIAHEFGHHVQTLLGIEPQVSQAVQRHPDLANELSVRTELQADCFAGVWAHSAYTRGELEPGDLEEGVNAAAAVGDDRIQADAAGRVNPETFTHGTAAQRASHLLTGYRDGTVDSCDTFAS